MVVLPLIIDQGLNAKLMVEKGLAIEAERSEDGSFSRDDIAKARKLAMVSKEGDEMRARLRDESFAWLELVSHRSFMPKLLAGNAQKGWPYKQRLLVDLFQFLESFLRNAELAEPVHFLYKGTLRVLLVLLHDYPEFLCDYHFSLCNVIPLSCIQMRNIILSAFPRNMRLPDPSTPNLKIDLLAEISQSPHILSEVDAALKAKQIKGDVDEYLQTRQQGSSFLTELKQKLLLPPNDAALAGTRKQGAEAEGHRDVPIWRSTICCSGGAGRSDRAQWSGKHGGNTVKDRPGPRQEEKTGGIGEEVRSEIIQEQITRVLLERLIVNRPHPWGLLITFIELIKNPRYNFWSRSFTRCAPEIEKLFESVSRSCGGLKPVDESMVSGGISDDMH
ncbi:hypothetical protein HYC85_000417 [Camellia sinensis]|uniref:CCR4-Not complex component Not1 C-terminal domain-containing protein n=1 Tax=Camellia sinensis TaxID=4442 RepID=A0A7J7I535_CAMSI|nr:hypothetical protein HYC85_000417 [Camellia sinensis]